MPRPTLVLLALCVLVWGGLTLTGFDGIQSVAQQHAPGFPSNGQIAFYIGVPLMTLFASIAWPLLLRRSQTVMRNMGPVVALLLLPLYLLPYTGGM